ncbi:hypothetical protein BGX20_011059 [Mortierella sp. AD010]|nr:hypothetical protein BGX20_011059 [Mortierella sp. AD010]
MSTIQRVRSPRFSQPPAATSPNSVLDTASRVASASPSPTSSRTPFLQSPASISKSEKRSRGRGHNFTIEQELYIAGLLADPEIWALLDGPGERNDHYTSKKAVHESIATKINSRFLNEASLKIDGAQIKNKIESMKKQWKRANTFLKEKMGDEDLTSNDLRKLVEDKCCFYYILQETWSLSRFLNPRDPVQLTENLTRPSICHFDNGTSEEEYDSTVEQDGAITGQASQRPESRAKKPKKPREDGGNMLALLQDLYKSNEIDQELKRQELEINRLKADAETRLIEMQIRKMESEIEIEKATFQAELAREDRLLEIEYLRAQTDFIQASAILMMEEVKLERARRDSGLSTLKSPPRGLNNGLFKRSQFNKAI